MSLINTRSKRIGDLVIIKKWKDLKKEFNLDGRKGRDINTTPAFTKEMKTYCGKTLVIEQVKKETYDRKNKFIYSLNYKTKTTNKLGFYRFSDEMFASPKNALNTKVKKLQKKLNLGRFSKKLKKVL